jgi:hypothetical protein
MSSEVFGVSGWAGTEAAVTLLQSGPSADKECHGNQHEDAEHAEKDDHPSKI